MGAESESSRWVKGHQDDSDSQDAIGNGIADELAARGAKSAEYRCATWEELMRAKDHIDIKWRGVDDDTPQ